MADDSAGLTDVINAPVDKIIDALTDFETFPDWQGACSSARCSTGTRTGAARGCG